MPETDSVIEGLNLRGSARDGALRLKAKHPGIIFTSGRRDKGDRASGPSHRQYATSAPSRDRDRPADPNSPFAKLAALKDQLTANRKDR